MNSGTDLHRPLEKILTKLYTLRDSCRGIARTRLNPDFSWFEAAAGICQEANDQIREAGRFLAQSKRDQDTDLTDKKDGDSKRSNEGFLGR